MKNWRLEQTQETSRRNFLLYSNGPIRKISYSRIILYFLSAASFRDKKKRHCIGVLVHPCLEIMGEKGKLEMVPGAESSAK